MDDGNIKRLTTRGTRVRNGPGVGGSANGPGCGGPAKGAGAWGAATGMGWGGPARGAYPAKERNLPAVHAIGDLDDMSFAEREAELRARSEVWRAKGRAFEARRTRLLEYPRGGDFGGPRPRPAFIQRASPR